MGPLRNRGGPAGTRYRMREKLFAVGDDFWIETGDGESAFKVDGKALRLRKTLVLKSPSGEDLFEIKERKLSVRDRMAIERHGETLATVKKALIERGGEQVAEVSKRWFRVRDTYGIESRPARTMPSSSP